MDRILISACLLGQPVRYNGTDKPSGFADILARWKQDGRLVPLCPEVVVGFPTPRPPAEILAGTGADVLAGRARVLELSGGDVSALYTLAAQHAVDVAQKNGCAHAVLTDGSPSCGSGFIYDGSFSGAKRAGTGTTTAALRAAGISVWAETQIAELETLLSAPPNSAA